MVDKRHITVLYRIYSKSLTRVTMVSLRAREQITLTVWSISEKNVYQMAFASTAIKSSSYHPAK